jgi:hypothetical protein
VTPIRAAFIAILYAALVTAAGRAGEWETRIDNGKPIILCFPTDVTLDQNYVLQSMSKLPDTKCKVTNVTTVGAVTSYFDAVHDWWEPNDIDRNDHRDRPRLLHRQGP